MLKLLVTLVTFLLLALALLGMRHHRLELTAQTARLHDAVVQRQHTLKDQDVAITRVTNPITLARNLEANGIATGAVLRNDAARPRPADDPGDLIAPLRRGRGH